MSIPRPFIDDLIARTDIVEIIDSYLPLRKAGKNYVACCPFHHEKTPSFSVSPDKQFYHCFGCGASGNVISFLIEHARLAFVEAVQELAERQGLSVPQEQGSADADEAGHSRALYGLLEEVAAYYQAQLNQPQATAATAYLHQRGLTPEICARFKIGYAPAGWNNLLHRFGRDSLQQQHLLDVGLLVEKGSEASAAETGQRRGYYDRFRERLMFPIQDQRGRVIGFGGRVLDNSQPKYLNSPETTLFHKGRELYGWHFVHKQRPLPAQVLVVEGYLDVVALAQYGIDNAVATLGTATSHQHLTRVLRSVEQVVFCFDGDAAGRKAAWRALETALPLLQDGRQASFVFLPDGEDPDSLVRRHGAAGFQQQLQQAQPLSQLLFEQLQQQTDTRSPEGRAKLAKLATPLLQTLPEGSYRALLFNQLSSLTGLPSQHLERTPAKPQTPAGLRPAANTHSTEMSPMRTVVALLIQKPPLAAQINDPRLIMALNLPGADLLRELLEFIQQHPHFSTGVITEHWRDTPHWQTVLKLAHWQHQIPDDDTAAKILSDALQRLWEQHQKSRLDALESRLDSLTPEEKQAFKDLHLELKLLKGASSKPH